MRRAKQQYDVVIYLDLVCSYNLTILDVVAINGIARVI